MSSVALKYKLDHYVIFVISNLYYTYYQQFSALIPIIINLISVVMSIFVVPQLTYVVINITFCFLVFFSEAVCFSFIYALYFLSN